jgi:hypothetical protein
VKCGALTINDMLTEVKFYLTDFGLMPHKEVQSGVGARQGFVPRRRNRESSGVSTGMSLVTPITSRGRLAPLRSHREGRCAEPCSAIPTRVSRQLAHFLADFVSLSARISRPQDGVTFLVGGESIR